MTLAEKFRQKCINRADWIRKNNLDPVTAYKVISGKLTGKINSNGNTRKVFETLLDDGFISELPSGLREDKRVS